jgi:hypothetical protein
MIGGRRWKEMKEHDYLYRELEANIDLKTIHLINRINVQNSQETSEISDWKKAA